MAVSQNGERRCKVSLDVPYITVHYERCCYLTVDSTMACSQNGKVSLDVPYRTVHWERYCCLTVESTNAVPQNG